MSVHTKSDGNLATGVGLTGGVILALTWIAAVLFTYPIFS